MNLAHSQPRIAAEPTSTDPDTPKRDLPQAARPQSPITWHIDGATLATFDAFIIGIPIRSGNFLGQRIRRRYSGTAPTAMGHRCVRKQVSMLTFSCAPWDHRYPHPPCMLLRIILIFFLRLHTRVAQSIQGLASGRLTCPRSPMCPSYFATKLLLTDLALPVQP
ncbi:hypothetical protein B0H14DRAFT_2923601 [Mycena olivaceomarginata]|nr:hypothetical protein B0H14DRAFT_2923601 [Mycena olivaceomarginata]